MCMFIQTNIHLEILVSFKKIPSIQESVCVYTNKYTHSFSPLKSSLPQEAASGAPRCLQQAEPVLPGAPQCCHWLLGGWCATTAGPTLQHRRQAAASALFQMHSADAISVVFMYPGACRVYDFSLFYFCCHVFSRASQRRSQSSQWLQSPGHSRACSPSQPGHLWSKLSRFPNNKREHWTINSLFLKICIVLFRENSKIVDFHLFTWPLSPWNAKFSVLCVQFILFPSALLSSTASKIICT